MDFLIYTTEECNLRCKYCESDSDMCSRVSMPSYDFEKLKVFIEKFPIKNLQFFGGEPLINMPFIERILDEVDSNYVSINTNGLLLDEIKDEHLNKFDQIAVSIDGCSETNDENRGKGTYTKIIEQVNNLRKRYNGLITARMTISPGVDIEKEVLHLINLNIFDAIHWQLNVLFHKEAWNNKEQIIKWFQESYNPGITNLIKYWTDEAKKENLIQLVPFVAIMNNLLTNTFVNNVRCGAGDSFFVINTDGTISTCPVTRFDENLGHIDQNPKLESKCRLQEPCVSCDFLDLCGGRCLYANTRNQWDKEGFELVCDSVKHLITELKKSYLEIMPLCNQGIVKKESFDHFHDFEVIP